MSTHQVRQPPAAALAGAPLSVGVTGSARAIRAADPRPVQPAQTAPAGR
jgi:hypothetical protein